MPLGLGEPVDLADGERRKGAGETCRGSRGQHEFERIGEPPALPLAAAFADAGAERDGQAMLAFLDLRG